MTQRADQADQTAGAGVGPSGDGASGAAYGSGQGGARMMLGAIVAVCVVGLAAVFWPQDRSITAADRASETGEDDQVIVSGDAVVNRDREVPPATGDQVRPAEPAPAATGPDASGEGLSDTPPDMNPAGEDTAPDAEIDPAETVEASEDPDDDSQ